MTSVICCILCVRWLDLFVFLSALVRTHSSVVINVLLVLQHDKEKLDPRGRTPLMLAVRLCHLQSVKVLLAAKCNANAEHDGWSGKWYSPMASIGLHTNVRIELMRHNVLSFQWSRKPSVPVTRVFWQQYWKCGICSGTFNASHMYQSYCRSLSMHPIFTLKWNGNSRHGVSANSNGACAR